MSDRRARLLAAIRAERRLARRAPPGILRTAVAAAALSVICATAAVPAPAAEPLGAAATVDTSATEATAATATSATIAPTLSPDRLGARAQLTFTIHFAGGELGVPAPVARAVLKFPAGLTLDVPNLRSCSPSRLQTRGVSGCPAQSRIGGGHAIVEAYLGSQLTVESVTLWAFLGPLRNLQGTVEIFGEGYAPLGEQMVLTALGLSEPAPYGEGLELSLPPIPTVPPGSNASILSFTLAIGTSGHRNANANTVLVPSRCPAGGFPFAAEFTYVDGSSGRALATVPCPR
jgi:hypothetical protein